MDLEKVRSIVPLASNVSVSTSTDRRVPIRASSSFSCIEHYFMQPSTSILFVRNVGLQPLSALNGLYECFLRLACKVFT